MAGCKQRVDSMGDRNLPEEPRWLVVRGGFFQKLLFGGPIFAVGPPCVETAVGYIKRFAWMGSTG